MGSRVVALTDIDGKFIDRWRALANRADTPNPFFDVDFLNPAAACMPEARGLRLLVGEDRGDLIWLMPLAPSSQLGAVPMVPGLRNCVPRAYCGQPLVVAGQESAAADFVLRYLSRSRRSFWLRLQMLDADNQFTRSLIAGAGHASVHVEAISRGLAMRRPEPTYVTGNPGAEQVRRQTRLFEEAYGRPLEVIDCSADPQAVEDFLAMEVEGGRGRISGAFAAQPGHGEFLRRMCSRFRDTGRLQLWRVQAGDQTVAMTISLGAGDTLFRYVTAFAPGYPTLPACLQSEVEHFQLFHDDHRFRLLDSCASPGNLPLNALYPDRRSLINLTIGSGPLGRVVTSLAPTGRRVIARRKVAVRLAAEPSRASSANDAVSLSGV